MAQTAETFNFDPDTPGLRPEVPETIESTPREEGGGNLLDMGGGSYSSDIKGGNSSGIKEVAEEVARDLRDRATSSYKDIAETSKILSDRFSRWFESTREEKPLQLVGMLAAAAFVAGILLRSWRSTRYE